MPRGARSLLLALVVLGALVAAVILAPGDADETPAALLATPPGNVSTLALERRGRPVVTLAKSDAGWTVRAPVAAPANTTRALALAGLGQLVPERTYAAADAALEPMGLEPPAIRLRIDDVVLDFGQTDPVSGLRYVRKGETVYLVEDVHAHHLRATPESFIDVRPLGPGARVAELQLHDVTVTRGDTGPRWSPADRLASADDATALLDAWTSGSAVMVETFDLGQRWGRPVQVRLDDGRTLRFVVARTAQAVYLGRQDLAIQYRMATGPGARLLGAPPGG